MPRIGLLDTLSPLKTGKVFERTKFGLDFECIQYFSRKFRGDLVVGFLTPLDIDVGQRSDHSSPALIPVFAMNRCDFVQITFASSQRLGWYA